MGFNSGFKGLMQSQIPEDLHIQEYSKILFFFRCYAVQCGINSLTCPKSDLPACFIMKTETVLPLEHAVCVHKFVCRHVSEKRTFKNKIFMSGCHVVVDFFF